jgi:protein-tyrosine phosphatase
VTLHQRELAWEGLLNVRDLGGHSTEDGDETRYGRVVRADSVRRLTDAGWQALVDYGIRTVIDLRTDEELKADPPRELPVDVVHIPVLEEDADVFAQADKASDDAVSSAMATRDVYLIFLERFKANFARAVAEVARAPEGGVVVHCAGGKDRTGLVTALLLRLAGVETQVVAEDYALSEERLRPRHDLWLAEAETEAERERIRRIAVTPPEAMTEVLDELERRYGSIDGYLRAGGATDDDLARARARLRD